MRNIFECLVLESGGEFRLLTKLTKDSKKDIDSLYSEEEFPIFEHSPYHAMSYFEYGKDIYFTEFDGWQSVVGIDENAIIIFTPKVTNIKNFRKFLDSLRKEISGVEIKVQNVSRKWIKEVAGNLERIEIIERSKEEVVYDVQLLTELSGKEFSKLRSIKNKLLRSNLLSFKILDEDSFGDAESVIKTWQNTQGIKYNKDRFTKEIYVLRKFKEFSKTFPNHIFAEVGYFKDKPMSYYLMHVNNSFPKWVTLYSLKGLNRVSEGGCHGVSDATYYRVFSKAQILGFKYINDGELGLEDGTRKHKLRFKPIKFLQSYDVVLRGQKQQY